MAESNNSTTYELNTDHSPGGAVRNLVNLLGADISREQLFAGLQHIEEHNDPSEDCVAFIQIVTQQLESKEPNQLPSFELLRKLAAIKTGLKEFASVGRNTAHVEQLEGMIGCFVFGALYFLPKLYGRKGARINFPTWMLSKDFLHVVAHRRHLSKKAYNTRQRLWNELLDLWKQIPLTNAKDVEDFREIVAPEPRS